MSRPISFAQGKLSLGATTDLPRYFGLWFSRGVDIAARIVRFRSRRAWRQVGERFGVRTLRTGHAIELRKRGVVAEECLQACRLCSEQLDLGVKHIQLSSCACIQAGFGQTQCFIGLLYIFLLALNQFAVLL